MPAADTTETSIACHLILFGEGGGVIVPDLSSFVVVRACTVALNHPALCRRIELWLAFDTVAIEHPQNIAVSDLTLVEGNAQDFCVTLPIPRKTEHQLVFGGGIEVSGDAILDCLHGCFGRAAGPLCDARIVVPEMHIVRHYEQKFRRLGEALIVEVTDFVSRRSADADEDRCVHRL